MNNALKSPGFVRTPPAIAALLTRWALRSADDHVLDPGFGEGTFLLESARCLLALGTPAERLASQLHGTDSRPEAASMLRQAFRSGGLPTDLPGIRTGSFLTAPLPLVDVLIGNPPAVYHWQQRDVDVMRAAAERLPGADNFPRLTDPQCHFVVHAARFLRPGGRLAVVLSDSWMDMRYGTAFKDYLLRTFTVRGVLGFQGRIFPQVQVRPVVLLAEKRGDPEAGEQRPVPFVFFTAGLPGILPGDPGKLLDGARPQADGAILLPDELKPEARWTPLLYAPKVYKALREHPGLTPLGSLAQVRLGLQTFAKMFYVVSLAAQQRWQLERRWLMPLLLSPKDFDTPCLSFDLSARNFVLACNTAKDRLAGTRVLRYIEYWENQVLTPRGQVQPVIGVQNLPRVARTRRVPWYNLLDHLTRRGTAPILLPRRMYRRLRVVWNQAGWVAGENFIEITPKTGIAPQVLLAVLNTGIAEMALRVNAHVYGGRVYSLDPGGVGDIPVVDVRRLAPPVLSRIVSAYNQFLRANGSERGRLDAAVFAAAGLPDTLFEDLQTALGGMQELTDAVVRPVSTEDGDLPEELRLL
jgi:hypothetical protein